MQVLTAVDGIGLDDDTARGSQPGVLPNFKLKWLGQAANTAAGNVANQGIGTVGLPALGAGAEGTVTVTDSLITASSLVFVTVVNANGDTTAGARVTADVRMPASGSVVVHYKTDQAMSAAWAAWYWVVN